METITLDNDIKVFYVTATSFPGGILEAHQRLHTLVAFSTERKYFGISRPEGGPIVYRAATEEKEPGEAERLSCETLTLKHGRYVAITIHDYLKDVQSIDRTFKQLLSQPGIDPNGYCVEWYLSDKDVRCMVRLAE